VTLLWRILVSAALIVMLATMCYLDVAWNFGHPGVWLVPLGVLVTCMGVGEALDLLRSQGLRPAGWAAYGGALSVFIAACAPVAFPEYATRLMTAGGTWPLAAMALAMVMGFAAEMQRYQKPGGAVVRVSLVVFLAAYIGVPLGYAMSLRVMQANDAGMAALLTLIVIVKLSDIGAYAVGKSLGRTKLAPRISPAKTVEGAMGGLVFAMLGAAALFLLIMPGAGLADQRLPGWKVVVYAASLSAAGMVGDVAESLLKRDLQRKDSSTWMPGLGGVLDFLDSLLFAAPLAYGFWLVGFVRF